VTASLRAVPEAIRAGVEGLFAVCAVFAEDAVVPAEALDLLAPLMPGDGTAKPAAGKKLQVRRWVQQLLKASLLKGSIEGGVSYHDLVRDCMIRRAEQACEGGLRVMQREAVPLLLGAVDAKGPAAGYASESLQWHVRQAQQPGVAIQADALLMSVLAHESGEMRKQGALGVGVGALRAAADACDAAGEHFEAAQLMWAAGAVRGSAAGAEGKRAWASLRQLNEAGRDSSASRMLERRVLTPLMAATEGGYAFGSAEYEALLQRVEALGLSVLGSGAEGAAVPSKEAFDAESGLLLAS